MAFPMTKCFSWTTTIYSNDSAVKSSPSLSFHPLPSNLPTTRRRPHSGTSSRRPPSPSSTCCTCCCSISSNRNVRDPPRIAKSSDDRPADSASSSPELSILDGKGKIQSCSTPIRPTVRTLRFKSLFKKRSLWKRIFFASEKVRSIILLNVLTIVYASNIPVLKEVEAIMDPAAFSALHFAVSAIPFVPFIIRSRNDAQTRNAGIELGLWVSLGYFMQALGLLTSDAGRASFMTTLTVIVVPLLDGIQGAKVPTLTWFGALMSIMGVAMLESSGSPPSVRISATFIPSGIWILLFLCLWNSTTGSTLLVMENVLEIIGFDSMDTRSLYRSFNRIVLMDRAVRKSDAVQVVCLADADIHYCGRQFMAAMMDVSATETAIIYALEPVWGAGFAWFLLGERWGAAGWVGAALVLGGSLTVQVFGSLPSSKTGDDDQSVKQYENHLVRDKQNGLSASPVIINSKKVPNIEK
ncbi:hypothetical protein Dimus_014615 [Dionaea muscipula]